MFHTKSSFVSVFTLVTKGRGVAKVSQPKAYIEGVRMCKRVRIARG